jgi:cytochrome c peroxidase
MSSVNRALLFVATALLLAAVVACVQLGYRRSRLHGGADSVGADLAIGTVLAIKPPLGLPSMPVPGDNPVTAEKAALGRRLFYDKRLSFNDTLSCASCHNPLLGFADGRSRSVGAGGKMGVRNAPSIANAAYNRFFFWDGRAASLEDQVGVPMEDPIEMNQPHAVTESRIGTDATYRRQFASAFGPGPVTIGKIEKALASFERTLLSADSPFDRYEFRGDKTALGPAAIRGLAIFKDPQKGNCAACHTIGKDYALFTDGKFHNTGLGVNGEGELTDLGRYEETKVERDQGAFKTASLRNVAQSAPYMHDGSLKTLNDVVDFYAGGGNSNPYLDKEMKPLNLTRRDRSDLVEFLKSLSGTMPANAGPPQGQP